MTDSVDKMSEKRILNENKKKTRAPSTKSETLKLSNEQTVFIDSALEGANILVDACIGSGKTTAIQELCNKFPATKTILYLTYNGLLKYDAKARIKKKNVTVADYHGFAFSQLKKLGISADVSDLIQTFNREKPDIPFYDVLIIDEYQDIERESADLLEIVKTVNPGIQIIAVGDMQQKIHDKTTLNVESFIDSFLGEYKKLEFTKCFRLPQDLAAMLGRVWKKKIEGVNSECVVERMTVNEVIRFLSVQNPSDILCLGQHNGIMSDVLYVLERRYPRKYNKKTVYADITDNGSGANVPRKDSAIFTTYDSGKGLERPVCVVFNFTEDYWSKRIDKPQQDYTILRNTFCMAASRGKSHIIFVKDECEFLSEKTLSAYKLLSINKIKEDSSVIDVEKIAVIDTETTYSDKVMSLGIAVADSDNYELTESRYYIFNPEFSEGGMYSSAIRLKNQKVTETTRENALKDLICFLVNNHITKLFAYNAAFDKRHLPELDNFDWYDIMKIAAYRQYNSKIPDYSEFTHSGRLKNGYGVEPMMKLLSGDTAYVESHNAEKDAVDELKIMRLLNRKLSFYKNAQISKGTQRECHYRFFEFPELSI